MPTSKEWRLGTAKWAKEMIKARRLQNEQTTSTAHSPIQPPKHGTNQAGVQGDAPAAGRHEAGPESIDGPCEQLANTLALKAIGWPPQKLLAELRHESGYEFLSESCLRFGLSIANQVLNVWLLNKCIPTPHRAKQLIDSVHRAFFKLQHKTSILIGDFIVTGVELSQITNEIEISSKGRVSNVKSITTTWWTLMDMVYLSRQSTYYDALENAAGWPSVDGSGPVTRLAFALATHLTGLDTESGGRSFIRFTGSLDALLALYEKHMREFLSGN